MDCNQIIFRLFVLKNFGEASEMWTLKVPSLEALFILGFGVFHFVIPFILPPNFTNTTLFGVLRIADLVLPGTFTVAISSIIFYLTRNRYPAALLAFLYGGGIAFHLLYLSGVFPSIIIVPDKLILVAGIVVDALSITAIYDYYRRVHLLSR